MKNENIEDSLKELLRGQQIPILILDTRWHALFPPEKKTSTIKGLEERLGDLLKEQGKLVNEIKDLKYAKKKLLDSLVSNMGENSEKKSQKSTNLIMEMNERIEKHTARIMELPFLIKEANNRLLVTGIKICYQRLSAEKEELELLEEEINAMRQILKSKVAYKVQKEEEREYIYSTMHDMLGPVVIEVFDND